MLLLRLHSFLPFQMYRQHPLSLPIIHINIPYLALTRQTIVSSIEIQSPAIIGF